MQSPQAAVGWESGALLPPHAQARLDEGHLLAKQVIAEFFTDGTAWHSPRKMRINTRGLQEVDNSIYTYMRELYQRTSEYVVTCSFEPGMSWFEARDFEIRTYIRRGVSRYRAHWMIDRSRFQGQTFSSFCERRHTTGVRNFTEEVRQPGETIRQESAHIWIDPVNPVEVRARWNEGGIEVPLDLREAIREFANIQPQDLFNPVAQEVANGAA